MSDYAFDDWDAEWDDEDERENEDKALFDFEKIFDKGEKPQFDTKILRQPLGEYDED